jgi:hypothetical protein
MPEPNPNDRFDVQWLTALLEALKAISEELREIRRGLERELGIESDDDK